MNLPLTKLLAGIAMLASAALGTPPAAQAANKYPAAKAFDIVVQVKLDGKTIIGPKNNVTCVPYLVPAGPLAGASFYRGINPKRAHCNVHFEIRQLQAIFNIWLHTIYGPFDWSPKSFPKAYEAMKAKGHDFGNSVVLEVPRRGMWFSGYLAGRPTDTIRVSKNPNSVTPLAEFAPSFNAPDRPYELVFKLADLEAPKTLHLVFLFPGCPSNDQGETMTASQCKAKGLKSAPSRVDVVVQLATRPKIKPITPKTW